jgi:hypothetical protein
MSLKKRLALNKLTAEHEINQIRRNQNEISRRMTNMSNIANADVNKVSNLHQTSELKRHQNDILSEMKGMGVGTLGASETKRLRREGEMSDMKRGQHEMVSLALMHNEGTGSDTSRGGDDYLGAIGMASEMRSIANTDRMSHRSHRSARKSGRKS